VEVPEARQEIVALVVDKAGALVGLEVALEVMGEDIWAWGMEGGVGGTHINIDKNVWTWRMELG
jgi:hypothetical protein